MTVSPLRRQTRSLTQLGQQLPMLIMLVINRPTLFVSAPLPTTLKESKSLCPLTLARHGPKTMVQLMVSAVARSHYLLTETRFSGVLPATVCKYLSTRIPSPPSLHCLLALLSLQTRRTIQSSTVLLDPNSTSQTFSTKGSPGSSTSPFKIIVNPAVTGDILVDRKVNTRRARSQSQPRVRYPTFAPRDESTN